MAAVANCTGSIVGVVDDVRQAVLCEMEAKLAEREAVLWQEMERVIQRSEREEEAKLIELEEELRKMNLKNEQQQEHQDKLRSQLEFLANFGMALTSGAMAAAAQAQSFASCMNEYGSSGLPVPGTPVVSDQGELGRKFAEDGATGMSPLPSRSPPSPEAAPANSGVASWAPMPWNVAGAQPPSRAAAPSPESESSVPPSPSLTMQPPPGLSCSVHSASPMDAQSRPQPTHRSVCNRNREAPPSPLPSRRNSDSDPTFRSPGGPPKPFPEVAAQTLCKTPPRSARKTTELTPDRAPWSLLSSPSPAPKKWAPFSLLGSPTPAKSPSVPASPYVIHEDGGSTFCFTLRKAMGIPLGLDTKYHEGGDSLSVAGIRPGGAVESWNKQCVGGPAAGKALMAGDVITSVNGIKGPAEAMLEECRTKLLLRLVVARGVPEYELGEPACTSFQSGSLLPFGWLPPPGLQSDLLPQVGAIQEDCQA
mmetsp:Transcript_73312/g.159022  ORF Transcript_73312/g.159022 Transcript_73312/m.159022 type:complete len:478 (-) Transcript_73312:146-1579(-)